MKKIISLLLALVVVATATAQDFPYGKILNYTKSDFIANKFKFDEKNNQWRLAHHNGLQAVANVASALTVATDDIRPHVKDYEIIAQLGLDGTISWIRVTFYNSETYHTLLTFANDEGKKLLETKAGNTTKLQFKHADYNMLLQCEHHGLSGTSMRTNSLDVAKTRDESWETYRFIIYTETAEWSKNIEKSRLKGEKRDAKGKKKRDVSDLM